MEVRNNEFPVVVQAYETSNKEDVFIAEQVVHSQAEIDGFTSRFAGKLIKARALSNNEVEKHKHVAERREGRSSSSAMVWIILLVIIAAAIGYGLYTGWIQRTFNLDI